MNYKKTLETLLKKGFQPEKTVEIMDTVYKIGSPYPQELICRWWAENDVGERLLIEEKILKCEE